jgi:2-succinyl-5-enolpyruvyl-6-hydroxy-3-cyclohexene-1-carboxylate synthase
MTEAANLLSEWSSLFLASLADAGVRDVVMSPGSRSTPLVAAAIREPRLRLHDVIDERAAAFFALGQARVTGAPSVVLCTSGSAGAHYFPAVIEANASGLPLVVLTADRPIELQGCGAAQTIDQTKLFGEHVRRFVELGMPDANAGSLVALRRMAAQAVAAARGPVPGAVHVNMRARKPLEPAIAATDVERALAADVLRIKASPIVSVGGSGDALDPRTAREIATLCDRAERGLIVCGPAGASFAAARDSLFALARATGFPVLAELTSQLVLGERPSDVVFCDGFDAVLRTRAFRAALAPDLVLQLGVPTSTGFEQWASELRTTRVVLCDHAWLDPPSTATHVVLGSVAESVRAIGAAVTARRSDARDAFRAKLARAGAVSRAAADAAIAGPDLTEGEAARVVLAALPAGSALVLGNSLPIRNVDAFGAGGRDAIVLSQRGANGIDGLVAGSCGAARALGRAVTLLLGDVSLLHDLTSLGLARDLAAPLVVVVVNNHGGRIFEQLPLGRGPASGDAELRSLYERTLAHVCTPHDLDLEHAARLFGLAYARVATKVELEAALGAAYARSACTVVDVSVPPSGAAAQLKKLWTAVEAGLASA